MSEQIDWSKAPDGAMVLLKHVRDDSYAWAVSHSEDARAWHKWNIKCSFHLMASMWSVVAERPSTPSWSGEGLPPVGVDIEVQHELYGLIGARVVGQDGEAAIVRTNDGYAGVFPHQMRPIRTPEQIAADEREAAIKRACSDIEKQVEGFNVQLSYSVAIRATIEAMIDAGYRKQSTCDPTGYDD